ncbi:MAG: hypothetical protein KAI47_27360, partial [Deltaproteobacteria bacterium]|nr:hypothetical protein [Deltaproteobacteria bacterium]
MTLGGLGRPGPRRSFDGGAKASVGGDVTRRDKEFDVPSTSDLKRGVRLEIDGEPFVVVDVSVQSPSARGAATL